MGAVYTFPAECPKCKALMGMPYRAATMPSGATCVDLRCRECGHEWQLEIAPSIAMAAPKTDRRKFPR